MDEYACRADCLDASSRAELGGGGEALLLYRFGGGDCPTMDPEKIEAFVVKLVEMGHQSPEHVSFTFAIDGVSRALSHQLVRHRIALFPEVAALCGRKSLPDHASLYQENAAAKSYLKPDRIDPAVLCPTLRDCTAGGRPLYPAQCLRNKDCCDDECAESSPFFPSALLPESAVGDTAAG